MASSYSPFEIRFCSNIRSSTWLRRRLARMGFSTGSYLLGEAMIPASRAASDGETFLASRRSFSSGSAWAPAGSSPVGVAAWSLVVSPRK